MDKLLETGEFVAENKEVALKEMAAKIEALKKGITIIKKEIKEAEEKKKDIEKSNSEIINLKF